MEASRLHSDTPSALPAGTRLGEFELRGLLGVGGFGIVYLAFDHALEREVAVKEYMPASLAGRTETMHVSLRSQSDAETFALGLKSFVNEARLLARFDHPSLLKVHRFWEANGTAYMAMPVMRGRTVKEVRLAMSAPPDEAWLRALLEPLLGAIEKLHSEGVYHRDIAPDNIQIEPGGHPVLLDFGAARRVIGDKSQTLTAILKPAYAPIEQYAEVGSVRQGPWTDIYALGATLHFLLLGRPPPPATARAVHDDASALTAGSLPGCSENFLQIVDWMLAPRPGDRPQSVAALRAVLDGSEQPPLRTTAAPAPSQWDRTLRLPPNAPPAVEIPLDFDADATMIVARPPAPPPAAPVAPLAVADVAAVPPADAAAPPPPAASPETLAMPALTAPPVSAALGATAAPSGRSKALPIGLGLGAVVVAIAAAVLWPRHPAPEGSASAASAAGGGAPAVATVVAPVAATQATTVPTAAPVSTAPAPAPAPVPAATTKPESRIATVELSPATPVRSTPPPTRTESATVPSTTAARPGAADRPGVPHTTAATAAAQPAAQTAATPKPEAARPQADATPPHNDAPPAAAAAQPAAADKAAPVGPEATCSAGRNPLQYFFCMEKECLRSDHPDCQKWHKAAKRE